MAVSALASLFLIAFWTISGRAADLLLLIALIFFASNTFYLFFTRPTIMTSDIIQKVSAFFARASLELQYQAQEAHEREVISEKNRLNEAEYNQQKLQAARDFLEQVRAKIPSDRKISLDTRQITQQFRLKDPALPAPVSYPAAADSARLTISHDTVAASAQPTPSIVPSPSSAALN
ncbi:hypothetical protein [Methylobacterium sp. J-076]|uniref:hypothetical protein n=1 Tax=Methylobacterium sp. J-076 TaxID=2836655 RepID=UPI001FB9152A|nr:hypothetical protein [Methylobacterium sp. J-076]MCJ2014315.1 hypothetical protein [Methylobacterium sp. J-076]